MGWEAELFSRSGAASLEEGSQAFRSKLRLQDVENALAKAIASKAVPPWKRNPNSR